MAGVQPVRQHKRWGQHGGKSTKGAAFLGRPAFQPLISAPPAAWEAAARGAGCLEPASANQKAFLSRNPELCSPTAACPPLQTMSGPPTPLQQQQPEGGGGSGSTSDSSSSDSLLSRGLASVNASTQAVSDRVSLELRSRQAQLLAAEREVRGRLWSEYEAQVRELEPTLRLRGQM